MHLSSEREERSTGLFFLDSGAFSLWVESRQYAQKNRCSPWEFYDSEAHWQYLDAYGAFINKYKKVIDYYANVDVVGSAELTWRNQKYLEEKFGLQPVPVVHFRSNLKWLHHYIANNYDYIGLGGLVGSMGKPSCQKWLDNAFCIICDTPNQLPKIRVHGFAVTGYQFLLRYPWWSVDSASWTKVAAYGGILVPHKRKGKFTFEVQPYVIAISNDSPSGKLAGQHYKTLKKSERLIVSEWLEEIDVPLGQNDEKGEVITYGVSNRHSERKIANLLFFERLRTWLPIYPWPFRHKPIKEGFGLT